MGEYHLTLELVALESVDGRVLGPGREVQFTVLWETTGTLHRLTEAAE